MTDIDLERVRRSLRVHLGAFRALYEEVAPEEAAWRPDDGAWSLLEILAHLADEERDDFRTRLDLTLHQPEVEWPPIDPAGWVTERDYASYDLRETWRDFESERERSLKWLAGLQSPDWQRSRTHPVAGTLHAGDLLTSWEAHDLLHLRQVAQRRYQYLAARSGGYGAEYAGDW